MERGQADPKLTARHAALVVAALYAPYLWILFHAQRPYLLEAFPFLPGLPPATALGQKTSDRLVAGICVALALALLVALGLGSERRARVAEGVALACGCLGSLWVYAMMQM